MAKETIQALVDGGKASAGPPLGPKLGPMGVNVAKLIADINEATKDFAGMKVPVDIVIDTEKKTWEIKVGTPPTSQLLLKEAGAQKGAGKHAEEKAGDLTKEAVVKVARIKKPEIGCKTLKSAAKVVLGTCVSAGLTVEGKDPKEAQKDIDAGAWDSILQ